MSLLLDAMKKSGDNAKSTGLSLEDSAPSSRNATSESADNSHSRAAGQALFAAKKKKEAPKFRWTLGLVPTTFIICSILGAGYGFYVWQELQPKQPQVAQRPVTPPPVAPITTPAQTAPSVASLARAPEVAAPKIEPIPEKTPTVVPAPVPVKPFTSVKKRAPRSTPGLTIEHTQEVDSTTVSLLDAYQAYQRGDYVTATQGYRNVLAKDAQNRDALLGLGAIAQQQNQDETAVFYYQKVLQLDPRDAVAQAAMSTYRTSAGEDTESHLKQLISEQPNSSALHFALGNVYTQQSRWPEAQQSYFNARTLEPNNAMFTYSLAVSLDHLGQWKLATQYYQQALQLDASNRSGFDHELAQQRLNELNPPSR